MIGHGRPTTVLITRARSAGRGRVAAGLLQALFIVLSTLGGLSPSHAETLTVRLRFAWGSGAQAPQKWLGSIAAAGSTMADLAPLGVEADEAAALRLADNRIAIAPLLRRVFDGCDVTVVGDEAAKITVKLRNSSATEDKQVEVALGELANAREPFRAQLDELGGYLLVQRSPGDKLRVAIDRKHLVFDPDEAINLSLTPDLSAEASESSLTLEARLYRVGGDGEVLWQQSLPVDPKSRSAMAVELKAPMAEGAYLLSLAARRPAGFAEKFVPWELSTPVATRDVEFVVVDPKVRLPRLADKWDVVSTIDAANPRWWQRVPQWTQIDRLPGLSSARPIGNIRPAVGAEQLAAYIRLPSPRVGEEPTWHAYPLAVPTAGEPYAIEIELPRNAHQRLSVSVIEPDAAGRVLTFGRDCGLYSDSPFNAPNDATAPTDVQRLIFWPRTTSPLVLISNQSSSHAAHYGKIRLVRRQRQPAASTETSSAGAPSKLPKRLVAAYISSPRLADCLGAAEQLDAAGGLSVDGWNTFLAAAGRLSQELSAAGYNAAIVSVSADGSSLTPLESLGASTKYDTGPLSSVGADPLRKDVLEALLRVFDREGLAFIPAVELRAPAHALEDLRQSQGARARGVVCLDAAGRTWLECYPSEAAVGAGYNVLNDDVQAGVGDMVDQVLERYGHHPSLAGMALQLSGTGYGVLPGLDWGLDDATLARFAADVQIETPKTGETGKADRTRIAQSRQWSLWRQQQLTRFYAGLSSRVRRSRPDRQLVLCTEDLFRGPAAEQRLRRITAGDANLSDAAAELGVDLAALAAAEGLTLLRPRLMGPEESLQQRTADLQVNGAAEFDQSVAERPRAGELFFHGAERLRLASFDAQSPYGADKTYLSLSCPYVPLGDTARRPLADALARRDFLLLAEGAEQLPLALEGDAASGRRVFRELPVDTADVRTERNQPVTLRIYRESGATTLCLINESPWPANCELPLEVDAPTSWRQLGVASSESVGPPAPNDPTSTTAGSWPTGAQTWTVALPPYGIDARRFDSRGVKIGALAINASEAPAAVLAERIAQIEQRMRNLDVERPYNELSNPDFELTGGDGRAIGWQPRMGATGAVEVDEKTAQLGQRSLRLQSVDAMGVAAQSHLFPIPATGQLVIRAQIRAAKLAPEAQLYAWVEYEDSGVMRQEHGTLGNAKSLSEEWAACEFGLSNLPATPQGKMRVHFYLSGPGEAWVDNVQLFDLHFPDSQRVALGKMLYAAREALDSGHLVECQRFVEGYWPRYLLEHVSPPLIASRPDVPAGASESGGSPSFGDRVRKLAPTKLWR